MKKKSLIFRFTFFFFTFYCKDLFKQGANVSKYPGGARKCIARAKELENEELVTKINEIFEIQIFLNLLLIIIT